VKLRGVLEAGSEPRSGRAASKGIGSLALLISIRLISVESSREALSCDLAGLPRRVSAAWPW